MEDEFSRCPECKLPTHFSSDRSSAYCARCNVYYRVGEGKERLKQKDRTISLKRRLFVIFAALGLVILLTSLSLVWFLAESDLGYIDIHDVNEIRGLPKAKGVPRDLISIEDLDEMLKEPLDDDEIKEIWELERFLECLFIIPTDWDLVDIVENESSGAGIAGFYDTEEERMYVVGDLHTSSYVNYILSHEYTHALQDQNFDLDTYMDTGGYDTDFARLCVIEGDAMITMEKWADKNLDDYEDLMIEIESIAQLLSTLDYDGNYYNEVLGEMTYFPYEGGLEFVKEVYEDGGYDAVNELFTTRPPLSSEQIIHHHKYSSYEEPLDVEVDIGDLDYELKFTSVVGEKLFSEMLQYNLGWSSGSQGYGYGWGGDSFNYYENHGDFLAVTATRWDTMPDNDRFLDDITAMFSSLSYSENNGVYSVDDGFVYVGTSGDATNIYYSSSRETIDTFLT